MKVVFYGLTITSSWGNGHATTYRSLCKALARRGHQIHFIEKDVEWHRNHRDLPDPEFCQVQLYDDWSSSASVLLEASKDADVVVVGSYFPDAIVATAALLDAGVGSILFYDIDTPVTLAQLRSHGSTAYLDAKHIPHYAAYLSFSGGPALRTLQDAFGSPQAVGFYCSVDPSLHKRTDSHALYRCSLSYLGTYTPDRQRKLMHYLNGAARLMPLTSFVVAGPQYPESAPWRPNVRRLDHVDPPDHPIFYSSLALHPQFDPQRYGQGRLLTFGAPVRGLRMRGDDSLRRLAGNGGVPDTREGNPAAPGRIRCGAHFARYAGRGIGTDRAGGAGAHSQTCTPPIIARPSLSPLWLAWAPGRLFPVRPGVPGMGKRDRRRRLGLPPRTGLIRPRFCFAAARRSIRAISPPPRLR